MFADALELHRHRRRDHFDLHGDLVFDTRPREIVQVEAEIVLQLFAQDHPVFLREVDRTCFLRGPDRP